MDRHIGNLSSKSSFGRNHSIRTVCAVLLLAGLQQSQVISAEPQAGQSDKNKMEKKVEVNDETPWKTFDPRKEDLEIEIVSEKTEDGIKITRLYYTSHKIDSKPVRVYGIYARPEKVEKKIPAILFIHGAGQTADEKEAVDMAHNGYAVFSHDWKMAEEQNKENHPTKWPFDENGKRLDGGKYLDSPGWLARRAITLLEKQPEVDPDHIGVYGFSFGGFHTWIVNGTDSRVKAASPTCGMIWNPAPYMDNLSCPVLFNNATDDFFATMDGAEKFLKFVKVDLRRLTSPNENHNMAGTNWEATRLKWFNHYLKGEAPLAASPLVDTKTEDGKICVTVKAPSAESCTLIYSYGADPAPERCWFGKAMNKTSDGVFTYEILRYPDLKIWYYANCDYKDGTTLSSECSFSEPPAQEQIIKLEKSKILYDPATDGIFSWYFSWKGPVDDNIWHPWHSWKGTGLALGEVAGKPALYVKWGKEFNVTSGLFKAFLRSPGCPLRKSNKAQIIKLNVIGSRPVTIKVSAHENGNWTSTKPFVALISLTSGEGWESVEIPVKSFKRENNETKKEEILSSFDGVKQFHLWIESADKTGNLPAVGIIEWGQ